MNNSETKSKTIIDVLLEMDRLVLAYAYIEYSTESKEKTNFNKVRAYVQEALDNKEFELIDSKDNKLTSTKLYMSLLHAIAEAFCEEH